MGLGSVRRTVMVTGAAGFVGSHLVDRLLAEGFEVVGLDNLMTGNLGNLQEAQRDRHFHLEIGDVRESLHAYAEWIFNLACPASPVHYQFDPYATLTTSVLGAMRLVDHSRLRKCRIIHASTSEVYGDPLEHPQREGYWGNVNPIGERACYDEGKRAAETFLMDARRTHQADVRILRIFNTYGPRMAFNDGRVVSNFVTQALSGRQITIFGDGTQTRSFCYVSDLVEGMLAAARAADVDGPVNLGNPRESTMIALAETVRALVGSRVDLVFQAAAPSTIPSGAARTSRAPARSLGSSLKSAWRRDRRDHREFPGAPRCRRGRHAVIPNARLTPDAGLADHAPHEKGDLRGVGSGRDRVGGGV